MMQKVQGLIFAVFSLGFSLLFHLSLTVRSLYRSNGVFSIAYTGTSKCFSWVWEVALLFQVMSIGLEFGIKTIWY